MTLDEILRDDALRARFVADGVKLIEAEVARKGGLSGMAIRAGLAAIKSLKPRILTEALTMLLPAFAPAIEPHFAEAQRSGDVARAFAANAPVIAEAMLAVTDRKAESASNAAVKKTYRSLRPMAAQHTTEAIPAVGALLATFV